MAIFSKCLSKTDIGKRLSVPSKSLKYFPLSSEQHAVDFKVKDENGRVWTFRCYTRRKKHLKPVLTKGWREFVCTKKLEIGDKVEFCKEDEEGAGNGTRYCVKVKKVVRVFGAALGHVPIVLPH
ncbi:hypothetical protein SLEP1_g40830 [Rubroshorea leprosula]|uniref:TF-B3 domain-containing protein n=1 Tax=Rubroshorea leprosula TaxID=152421 RepID=A0AAV5L4Q6_9ROSI|nr:hypothetical protein SLEP1_g40830 [Rubroshorea leprosula]